jgi:hypothetical protein
VPVFSDLDQRWRLLVSPRTVVVSTVNRKAAVAQVRAQLRGTPVALVGGRRLRWLAWRAHMHIVTMYVALPSLANPVAITEISPLSLRWTTRMVLTVPTGVSRLHALAWLVVRLIRAVPRMLSWAPAGDRIAVGIRS